MQASYENREYPDRRQFFSTIGQLGSQVGSLGLAGALAATLSAQETARPHFKPLAKHVIYLFMSGGPSHLDTFDPKPLLSKFAGQRPKGVGLTTERTTGGLLPSPFRFRPGGESGTQVSDLLPDLRRSVDEMCVIRSMHTVSPNHQPAINFAATGSIDATRPTLGAWVTYGLGSENSALPSFVALGGRDARLLRNGFLPGEHQGTIIDTQSTVPAEMIPNLANAYLDRPLQARQLEFLQQLNRQHLASQGGFDPWLEARIRSMETAFRMQFVAEEVCDLSRETPTTLRVYGDTAFGRVCLLARRMVEHGVRFVHVENGGWDHHTNINRNIAGNCRTIDQPLAALLGDLKQRGLLDETLVVWGGEFGRTPVSESDDGRDHNSYGFTMWLAGGGVRGGMSYGATDEFGFQAVENRVSVHDLHATILHLLGLDHERLTYRYSGRDFRLTDVHGRVLRDLII
jgi:hypothetical protein